MTVQNVFAELNMTPNSTPFDKIVLKGLANTVFARTCRYISLAFLIASLLTPLAFINSTFIVENKESESKIVISDHQLYDDHFTMVLSGTDINYDDIYARLPDGSFVFPSSIDRTNGFVTFPFDDASLNIYIPDINGNILQAILTKEALSTNVQQMHISTICSIVCCCLNIRFTLRL